MSKIFLGGTLSLAGITNLYMPTDFSDLLASNTYLNYSITGDYQNAGFGSISTQISAPYITVYNSQSITIGYGQVGSWNVAAFKILNKDLTGKTSVSVGFSKSTYTGIQDGSAVFLMVLPYSTFQFYLDENTVGLPFMTNTLPPALGETSYPDQYFEAQEIVSDFQYSGYPVVYSLAGTGTLVANIPVGLRQQSVILVGIGGNYVDSGTDYPATEVELTITGITVA